jgi:hypothetical protein
MGLYGAVPLRLVELANNGSGLAGVPTSRLGVKAMMTGKTTLLLCMALVFFRVDGVLGQAWTVSFRYSELSGIGRQEGVCRRDPSDVIYSQGKYHVWYTKVVRDKTQPGKHGYPSGYQGSVWHATSADGRRWDEQGEAICKGEPGSFDCTATFTPNVLRYKSRYYLYYTAVGPDFDNGPYEDRNRTTISVAESDSPVGPWRKVGRPILETTRDAKCFDSYRVDDACLVVRQDRVWLYYKGRQWKNTPRHTKMGVAIADSPLGEYRRANGGQPVQDSGHEVQIWPRDGAVMSIVSDTGPQGRTLQQSLDGIRFEVVGRLPVDYPRAPGLFRADMSEPIPGERPSLWGISMATYRGDPYLTRYDLSLRKMD